MRGEAAMDLSSIYRNVCTWSADKPAITFEGKTWTYKEIECRIHNLAGHFKDQGVRKGDRIGYVGQNHPAFIETLFACSMLGAIFVPLNYRLSGAELTYIINDAGLHSLVYDEFMQPTVESILGTICCNNFLAVEIEDTCHAIYDVAIAEETPLNICTPISNDDITFIMYTSGTTGLPKGVMLTHANIFWNDANLRFVEDIYGSVVLTCCPMYHIAGLNCATLASLFRGAHQHIHRVFDPAATLLAIEKHKISAVLCVPVMLLFMSQHESFDKTDFSSVRSLLSGGAPVPPSLIKRYQERGLPFYQVYGLTETAPFALINSAENSLCNPGAAGKPVFFCEVKITGLDGKELAVGEKGEICIRGPNVMSGYWNKPEATTESMSSDGWFFSGDVGYQDEEGFFYVNDRKKDMLISGGENIYPAEVEAVLYQHSAIQDVAVIGLPDEKWGETVVAVVVLKDDQQLSLDQLRDFCENKLARYKIPQRLHQIDELPRNPSGKILKYKLRDNLQSISLNVA